MSRLTRATIDAALDLVRGLHAVRSRQSLGEYLTANLPDLIPADATSYNEVDLAGQPHFSITWPLGLVDVAGYREAFGRHAPQHPLVVYCARTGDGSAHQLSDFMTQRAFERTGLYREAYRLVDTRFQMAIGLESEVPSRVVIGVAVSRQRRDFSERDRLVLNLLRPHILNAHGTLRLLTAARAETSRLERAVEMARLAVIVVGPAATIRLATDQARRWLVQYFDEPTRPHNRLPELLAAWLREQLRLFDSAAGLAHPRTPLIVSQEERRLVSRCFHDGSLTAIVLAEERTTTNVATVIQLGLTEREAEVILLASDGRGTADIARVLGIRPRTVAKHLERIYEKLGAESRAAAIVRLRALIADRTPLG